MNSFASPFGLARKFFVAVMLGLMLALSGCVTSGSGIASYGGSSLSSATAKQASARASVKSARKDVGIANRALKKITRQMARDTRRLKRKRISTKRRETLAKRIKSNKRKLRTAKRDVSKAERKLSRARNAEKRATRAIATAKRRKESAERRLAATERRQEQKLAQNEAKRDEPIKATGNRLFSLSDPALKNVGDYAARVDNTFSIPAIPVGKMNKRLFRQEVRYSSSHKPGTIVVDPHAKYLYLIQSGGTAMRYGIGVGRAGFEWKGEARIGWKQVWPKWTPPAEMIERQPELAKYGVDFGGQPGGPSNPLGARALYLMQGNVDTLYRLHGTPQWNTIGTAASSGCIRLMNQDIIDLYKRVPHGAKVVVL